MKFKKTKSFTIIEALLAIILFAIIIVVFFTAFMTSFNYLRRLMELRTATLILQEEVSLVRELSFSEIQELSDTFTSNGMPSLKDASGTIVKSEYNDEDEIAKITFKLSWTSFDGKPIYKTLVTLITDHGIDKK